MVVPGETSDAPVALVIPADAQFLHVLRTVTAGVASMLEIPYDTLDDQRLAVAEAANFLLGRAPASSTLTLRLWPRPDELIVSLEAEDAGAPATGYDDATTGFSWNIIQHLADAAEQEEFNGRHSITMSWTTLQHRTA
jgi:anti-sigma regulatory factor (Ser/Thr protein kinase)